MRGGSQSAFCQSRRLASRGNKMLQRMKDSSRRRIYDCRLSIVDLRSAPPIVAFTNMLFKVRNGAATPRDVKNEVTNRESAIENRK